jgi:pimeloyl-ACP methyl ester carboxylesterase
MTDGKAMYVLRRMSPGDLGLPFEPVEFTVPDAARPGTNLLIRGWWIAAASASDRTCVIVHGFGDAKVGTLAWAPVWRELGWNVLLIDLRAHGESGGTQTTGGFYEREDLDAVLNQLRALRPGQVGRLALFGVSLGGAVVLATASRRDDVDAVVADSVFADYGDAAIVHGRLIGAPLAVLTPLAIRCAEYLARARFADVRPLDTLRACGCPVMLIHGANDPFVPEEHVATLGKALHDRHVAADVHFRPAGAGHCMAIVADAHLYQATLRNFLAGVEAESRVLISASAESTSHA